jgi:hypothetical protein
VPVVRHATYLGAGRRGPPRSSLESFSAWVESLDKILKDLLNSRWQSRHLGVQVVDILFGWAIKRAMSVLEGALL